MVKIKYPDNGLNTLVSNCFYDMEKYINCCVNNAPSNIPDGFDYSSYLNNLKSKLQSYKKELLNIEAAVKNTDKLYKSLFSLPSQYTDFDYYDKVLERGRLIK